jgi:mannose-6-phosphate isomerase-like protein (cupin superfamily)
MRRSLLAPISLLTVAVLGLAVGLAPSSGASELQTAPTGGNIQFQVTLPEGALPVAPAFVRLLRITLDPGASSPLHTHPGPEFARVESGTLSVTVKGKALLLRAATGNATPAPVADAPLDKEFRMRRGDMLTYLPQTPMTFRNAAERPVKILSGVILPAGHQHPPGITYLGGTPSDTAFKGVTPDILGDGVATVLPTGPSIVTVDRLKLEAGEPIPAFAGPVMLSVASGVLDFTVVGGRVQVSRTAEPGPQPDAAPGTSFSLAKGDAAFFPEGMQQTPRSDQDGVLQLLRETIVPASETASPVAAATAVGVIAIATPAAPAAATATATTAATESAETPTPKPTRTPKPAATEPPAATATQAAPTPTTQTGTFKQGDHVTVTEDGVNLRTGPSTDADVVTQLSAGDELIITGPAEQGGDLTWWPVMLAADNSVTGYVAEQFIQLVQR